MRSLVALLFTLPAIAQVVFPPDLSISRIEAVQTVQDDSQSVPLTAGKATAVRVFVRQQGRPEAIVGNVTIALRGYRGGTELPQSPLRAANAAISAALSPDRTSSANAQNFVLPADWTTPGEIELRAELRLAPNTPEAPTDNNSTSRTVTFNTPTSPELRIAWVPLCFSGRCAANTPPGIRLVERFFPLRDGTVKLADIPAPAFSYDGAIEDLPAFLARLLSEAQATPFRPHILVGLLPAGTTAPAPAAGTPTAFWMVDQADETANEVLLARQVAGLSGDDSCPRSGEPGFDPLSGRLLGPLSPDLAATGCPSGSGTVWVSPATMAQINGIATTWVEGTAPAPQPTDEALQFTEPAGGETWNGVRTLRWTDASNRGLSYTLGYSNDNGVSWIPLAFDVRANEFSIDTQYLQGGLTRFRVSYDGGQRLSNEVFVLVAPKPEVSSTGLDFGGVTTGVFAERGLTVHNRGTGVLQLGAGTATLDAYRVMTPDPLAIRAGGSRTIVVRYTSRFAGAEAGDLKFPVNDTEAPELVIPVRAVGFDRAIPSINVLTSSLDFGDVTVGDNAERTFRIRNEGSSPLNVSGLSLLNARFTVTSGVAAFVIDPGDERTIRVRFTPLAAGAQTGSVSVVSNDPIRSSVRVELRGNGLAATAPVIEVNPTSLDFGAVGIGQSRTLGITVRNTGAGPLTITGLQIASPSFNVATPATPVTLAPAAQQVVSVRFAPQSAGTLAGTLILTSNDARRPRIDLPLLGSGTAAVTSQVPRVTGLVPGSLTAGSRRFDLTVSGTNFTASSIVNWNGSARPTVFVNATTLRASIAPDDVAAAARAQVTVVTLPPGGGTSNALPVVVNAAGPQAWLTNTSTATCPAVISTLTAVDRVGTALSSIPTSSLVCTEDDTTVPCSAQSAANAGSGLSIAVVMHTSPFLNEPSQLQLAGNYQIRAIRLFFQIIGLRDYVALTQFDNGVRLVLDFTEAENREKLQDGLNAARAPLGAGASLYDAVDDAIQRLGSQGDKRKAILLFSGSPNNFDSAPRDLNVLLQRVQSSGIPIYTFPIGPGISGPGTTDPALLAILNQLALDSGGQMFADPLVNIDSVIQRLAAQLDSQFLLQHTSPTRDATPKQLRVTINVPGSSFTAVRSFPGCR